jgi:drug/metabolite transporter (DMT)-like permease
MKSKQKSRHLWFFLGAVGILLAAPNATIIKATTDVIDPAQFNFIRFGMLMVVALPYLFLTRCKLNKENLRYALMTGVALAFAVQGFVLGVKYSQASYASILSLLSPIVFVFYSVRMTKEKISPNAIAGIALAAAGALIVVALPIAMSQNGDFVFNAGATALIMVSVVAYPLVIIFSKKANQAGLPLISNMAVSGLVVFISSALIIILDPPESPLVMTQNIFLACLYSGIFIALVGRVLSVAAYERIGSASISAISYFEKLVAIMIPVVVLGEELSIEMILGGIMILFGIFLVEYHTPRLFKHFHFYRHH